PGGRMRAERPGTENFFRFLEPHTRIRSSRLRANVHREVRKGGSMKIRARGIAVGLLVPAAIVMAVGTSGAATQPPVRKFEAHFRGSFALVTHRVPVIGSTKPAPSSRGALSASAEQLRLVGQGWAMSLGQSRLSGMVAVGQGSVCQPINGWVALST